MGRALSVGKGFFPLDEQLGLDGTGLTPRGQEALVRLAAWMSFEHASELLKELLGIQVSATSSRRYTYQAGQAALAVQQAEEERIREQLPEPPKGAERQAISADGAFVPLVGGEWAEAKARSWSARLCRTSRQREARRGSPRFRGWRMPRPLASRRSSNCIVEAWSEPRQCVP